MKKSFVSLALLYSLQLIPSTLQPIPELMPEPVVQDAAVVAAVESVKTEYYAQRLEAVLSDIEALRKELQSGNLSASDRAEIIAALVVLARKGELNGYDFKYHSMLVIAETIQRQRTHRARFAIKDIPAYRYGNSEGQNALVDMKKKGVRGSVIAPYFGKQAEDKFIREMSNSYYDPYRK